MAKSPDIDFAINIKPVIIFADKAADLMQAIGAAVHFVARDKFDLGMLASLLLVLYF